MPEIQVEWSEGDERATNQWVQAGSGAAQKSATLERRRCIEIVREAARDQWKMGTGGYAEIIRRIAKGR